MWLYYFSLRVLAYFHLNILLHRLLTPCFSVRLCLTPDTIPRHPYSKGLSWLVYMSPIELRASPMDVDQETLFVSDDDGPMPDQVW